MRLAPGTRLGFYEILAPLGAGGMGEVYRAHDTKLGRDVAIKLLPEKLTSSPERIARLEREARTVAALNHPNIVTLHTIEDADSVRFLVMELVEGHDLSTLVASGGLPLAQVLDVAIPLADALVAAHERHVVHRDLKPGNVMLTRDGRLKVLDFGLAKLTNLDAELDETRANAITDIQQVVGTRPYMAPEQIRGEEVDTRADLFAFGIVVYELAAGERPFGGQSSADVTSSILRDVPPPLSRVRADLPADLERILERCLEKNPRERFQTALDVANELRALKRTVERGGPTPVRASSEQLSIAILPFVNRSASPEDEYFSEGLADELLDQLAKIRGLRVAARSSAYQFKGKDKSVAEIGRALNVTTLLEGSVRKAGARVRISVQLVKVGDGFHVWSETYDRTLDDIFTVQDDIARSVVRELRATLLGERANTEAMGEMRAEVSAAAKGRTNNPEAYRLYLQARYLARNRNRASLQKGIDYMKQALALDPQFAIGWAQLSSMLQTQVGIGLLPPIEGFARAREAAERSLALVPELPAALGQIASLQMKQDWNLRAAQATLERRRKVAPPGLMDGSLARGLGRLEDAIAIYRELLKTDPLTPNVHHNLAMSLQAANRSEEAREAFCTALALAPERGVTHAHLALTLLALGKSQEALAEATAEPGPGFRLWAMAIVQWAMGLREESDRSLQQLIDEHGNYGAQQVAGVYAMRGETDRAFAWLERAFDQRDGGVIETGTTPTLRSLHGDPRWKPFLRKIGLLDS